MKNQVIKDNIKFDKKHPYYMVHVWVIGDKKLSDGAFRLFMYYQNAANDSVIETKNFHPTTMLI